MIHKTTNMFADHQKPDIMAVLNGEISAQEALGGGGGGGGAGVPRDDSDIKWYHFGRGIKKDLLGRLPYYLDDYKDGIMGKNTIGKTISTTLFLYFSVILPAVALGVLNSANTHGNISVQQVIVGQTIGAITFSLVAGQPLVVVMTTAPLALFIKIIYSISEDFEIDFLAFYGMIGLWNTFFLIIYSFCNMSVLMKYSSRSTEEIFSNFITIAFIVDSTKNMVKTFNKHYWADHCYPVEEIGYNDTNLEKYGNSEYFSPLGSAGGDSSLNGTGYANEKGSMEKDCQSEICFLSLILMLGTVW